MRALAIGLVVVAACGSKPSTSTTPADPGGTPADPGVVAQTLVGWGQQPAAGGALNLFLEVSDHTGASKSYPLGSAVGPCTPTPGTGGGAADIVTSLTCTSGGVGSAYRVVYRTQLIVLKRAVDPADLPEDVELSFQEILRVDVPIGAKVGPAT
ncbi:MAG: hypothetical protein R3B06_31395 [Kofleriaceae bacterium]